MTIVATPVEDGETLLRTDFSPENIRDGKVVPAGIRSDDLSTRGFSVDREHMVAAETLDTRAATQMAKDPENRKEAWIAPFPCGPVRAEIFPHDNLAAFRIEHHPEADNDAHSMIFSSVKRGRGQIKQLKSILLPYINEGLCLLDRYKADRRK